MNRERSVLQPEAHARAASRVATLAAVALAFGGALPIAANTVAVSPSRATITSVRPTETITLRNDGAVDVVFQSHVVGWRQDEASDHFEPTDEVIVSPPILTIPPQTERILRIGLRTPPSDEREATYRLLLKQIPTETGEATGQSVQFRFEFSLPVFALPTGAAPELHWDLQTTPEGEARLSAENGGNAHIQVRSFEILGAADPESVVAIVNQPRYLLAGAKRSWTHGLSLPPGDEPIVIRALTDYGPRQYSVERR